jgi:hypothetical protein
LTNPRGQRVNTDPPMAVRRETQTQIPTHSQTMRSSNLTCATHFRAHPENRTKVRISTNRSTWHTKKSRVRSASSTFIHMISCGSNVHLSAGTLARSNNSSRPSIISFIYGRIKAKSPRSSRIRHRRHRSCTKFHFGEALGRIFSALSAPSSGG